MTINRLGDFEGHTRNFRMAGKYDKVGDELYPILVTHLGVVYFEQLQIVENKIEYHLTKDEEIHVFRSSVDMALSYQDIQGISLPIDGNEVANLQLVNISHNNVDFSDVLLYEGNGMRMYIFTKMYWTGKILMSFNNVTYSLVMHCRGITLKGILNVVFGAKHLEISYNNYTSLYLDPNDAPLLQKMLAIDPSFKDRYVSNDIIAIEMSYTNTNKIRYTRPDGTSDDVRMGYVTFHDVEFMWMHHNRVVSSTARQGHCMELAVRGINISLMVVENNYCDFYISPLNPATYDPLRQKVSGDNADTEQ
jgi:hypothetical protein